jgi:uncharacterized protein YdhG (YjbR/CyaY superfamily)
MSATEVDAYLAALDETQRSTLLHLRADLVALLPDAEQCISYGAPAFRLEGKLVAGFSASTSHLSYLPHSGTVLAALDPAVLAGYGWSKGALKFPIDVPLDRGLVATLVKARLGELAATEAEPPLGRP